MEDQDFRKSPRLLNEFEQIVAAVDKHKGINGPFFKEAWAALRDTGKFLDISAQESALFALVLAASGEEPVSAGGIAKRINCNYIQFLKYLESFENLEKKRLIHPFASSGERSRFDPFESRSRNLNPVYVIPMEVIKAVREGRKYRFEEYDKLSPEDFFATANKLMLGLKDDDISYDSLLRELHDLFEANQGIAFVKSLSGSLKGSNLESEDVFLLLLASCKTVLEGEGVFRVKLLPRYLGLKKSRPIIRQLSNREHILIQRGLLEYACHKGIAETADTADPGAFRLAEKAKKELLSDVEVKKKKRRKDKEFIRAAAIEPKELFYTEKVSAQVEELRSLLRRENLRTVQRRLRDNHMRTGFNCLFSGPPGTGKTETAYQLARDTGRDIFLVDASETKSMWFGQSEKRIKELFDRYRSLVKAGNITPILLFNEADAVMGKRRALDESRSGGQTENAMQNIILQEMEDLKGGILIATTNMTCNFDKAFERRFLYKIEFEMPGPDARAAIWKTLMPGLPKSAAQTLSRRYDLSGGQIENVARKQVVSSVLHGGRIKLETLAAFCDDESQEKTHKAIGFLA